MTIKELCEICTSKVMITFNEDPTTGTIAIIIPVGTEPNEIIGEYLLDSDIYLMAAKDDAVILSITND